MVDFISKFEISTLSTSMDNIYGKCARIDWKLCTNILRTLTDPGKSTDSAINHGTKTKRCILPVIFCTFSISIFIRHAPHAGPYFARLDHQLYTAAASNYREQLWTVSIAYRLLQNSPHVLRLLGHIQGPVEPAPKYVRAVLYKFKYTRIADQ